MSAEPRAGGPDRILVRDAAVLTMDPALGDFARASILVEGERIAAVAPDLEADDAQVIEAAGMIALPGLIDAHRHLWQSPLTLTAADVDLAGYFAAIPGKLAPVYQPEDLYVANLAGALQALDAGITTLFDWSHVQHTPAHSDAAIDGLQASGLRAVFAYGFPNTGPEWSMDSTLPLPDDVRRVRRERLPGTDGLVTMALAIRGPEQSSLEITAQDIATGRELDLLISSHAGNGAFGLPYRSIERLDEAGLLGPDLQFVHGTSLTDQALVRIAETGGRLVSTPAVELQMQFGFPAAPRAVALDLRPGLGADVVTSTDTGLFGQMASAYQAARQQALEQDTPRLEPRDLLGFATLDGARAIGMEDRIGSLSPGKQADILLLGPPPLVPLNDPVAFCVLGADTRAVHTVLVAGQLRKKAGALVDKDLARLGAYLSQTRDALFKRAGLAHMGLDTKHPL
ncbi:MAG: amidohydrolase family protein [Pseudomonadota bacterium]